MAGRDDRMAAEAVSQAPALAPEGWYPDPQGGPGLRYWDGVTWTGHVMPASPAEPGELGGPDSLTKTGRPRRQDVQRPRCSRAGHSPRTVLLNGIRRDKNDVATHQRFICGPDRADRHTFIVQLADPASAPAVRKRPVKKAAARKAIAEKASAKRAAPAPTAVAPPKPKKVRELKPPRPWTQPEKCPDHEGSHVIRSGVQRTGKDGKIERQRYFCTPVDWRLGAKRKDDADHAQHYFQPVLPREHIHTGKACVYCQQELVHNSGAQAAGREHQVTLALAASSLRDLGAGMSYTEVGINLQEKLRNGGPSAKPKDAWRRAADLLEVFEPTLWADWTESLKAEPPFTPVPGAPRVVLLADLPVFGRIGDARSTQRFAIIAVGEALHVPGSTNVRPVRLRQLLALPNRKEDAYKLALDGLGYVPDFVVADGGKGIRPAVDALATRADQNIVFVISADHMALQLNRAIKKAKKAQPALQVGDLNALVDNFHVVSSENAWIKWWKDYERRLSAHNVPLGGWPTKWKKDYYQLVLDQLRAVAPFPDIPRSTGAPEALIGVDIKTSFERRGGGFGNLARTNQLTEAMVLHANRYFADLDHVVEVLRHDALFGDPCDP